MDYSMPTSQPAGRVRPGVEPARRLTRAFMSKLQAAFINSCVRLNLHSCT